MWTLAQPTRQCCVRNTCATADPGRREMTSNHQALKQAGPGPRCCTRQALFCLPYGDLAHLLGIITATADNGCRHFAFKDENQYITMSTSSANSTSNLTIQSVTETRNVATIHCEPWRVARCHLLFTFSAAAWGRPTASAQQPLQPPTRLAASSSYPPRMASGINIYSQLLISAIRNSDITISNY